MQNGKRDIAHHVKTKGILIVSCVAFLLLTLFLSCLSMTQPRSAVCSTLPKQTAIVGAPCDSKEDVGLKGEACIQHVFAHKGEQDISKRNQRRNSRLTEGCHSSTYISQQQNQQAFRIHSLRPRKVHGATRACDYYVYALKHILI